jgi:hypothetical protein
MLIEKLKIQKYLLIMLATSALNYYYTVQILKSLSHLPMSSIRQIQISM